DQPAPPASLAAQQRALAVGAVGRPDDDAVAFLEAAAAAEHDQRTGGAVTVGCAADGALDAIDLEVLAFAADDALRFHFVGAGILLGLPREPLPLMVGEGLAGHHQR